MPLKVNSAVRSHVYISASRHSIELLANTTIARLVNRLKRARLTLTPFQLSLLER